MSFKHFTKSIILQKFLATIFIVCGVAIVLYILSLLRIYYYKDDKVQVCKEDKRYELAIIRDDLKEYDLSENLSNVIIDKIEEASKKYKIPVMLLHAIFRIESDYKFWIEHDIITVKAQKTRAVGLGGIVWEYWADSLTHKNIAKTKSDLFLPQVNIEATAYILRVIVNSYNDKKINIREIIKRYYGVDDNVYYEKMLNVTSDLFIKRIERELRK